MRTFESDRPDTPIRTASSKAEARAAEWCAARLSSSGYEVEIDTFPARTSIASWLALDLGLSAAAALLMGLSALAAFGLGAIALVLYARDVEGRSLIAGRNATSRNVVASTAETPRVVVIASLDGPQGWTAWHRRLGRRLRSATIAVQVTLVAVPLVAAGIWIFGTRDTMRIEAVGAALAVLLGAAAFWVALHDDAPSAEDVDVPLQVALRIAELRANDVWVALTGASGAGNEGITALLDRHGGAIGAAALLNLDQLGRGDVVAAEEEGVLKARRAFGALVQAAEDAGAQIGDWRDTPTDGGVALARHFKAMTLLLGPGHEPDAVARMFGIVRTIVQRVGKR